MRAARNAPVGLLTAVFPMLFVPAWAKPSGQAAPQNYSSTQGSFLVQVELFNLSGKANKTGSFVMECHPLWAPYAVTRYSC
jgi:hypothetical protein